VVSPKRFARRRTRTSKTRYHQIVSDPKVRDRVAPDFEIRERVEHPKLWKVLLHNDDYTTQEFVVWVLETVFNMPHADAFAVMMHVHQSGVGVAGLFTRDVAETKVKATQRLAEQHEYPLLVTIEPETQETRE
jgi:ATP-dependent Clp protease adaptor protein ClpS